MTRLPNRKHGVRTRKALSAAIAFIPGGREQAEIASAAMFNQELQATGI